MRKFFLAVLFIPTIFLVSSKCLFAQSINAGSYHNLILCGNGTIKANGANWDAQLGDGTYNDAASPISVPGLTGIIATAGGSDHSIALKSDGTVWAWGYNGYGQLGDNTTTERTSPVQVHGPGDVGFLTGIVAIACGENHSIAVKSDGTVWAWGYNSYGQLGDNSTTHRYVPVQATGLTGITAVAGGGYHTVALKNDGSVWAFGRNNNGQLGDNTTTTRTTAIQVHGLANVGFLASITAIEAGRYHSIARKNDGTAWGWGYNGYGQLGDNSFTNRTTPVQATSLGTNLAALSAGAYFTLYVKNDGTVWATGANWEGALGDGTVIDRSTPVQMLGMTNAIAVAGGYEHSVIMKNDGSFWACGYNYEGELGDGTSDNEKYTAVQMHDCCVPAPGITLSDTCIIDTVNINGNSNVYLKIRNTGCAALSITNITSTNAVFTVSPTSVSVPAYDSTTITITYAPTVLGDDMGTLTIFNNANDTTLCLKGHCVPSPSISVTPSSFSASLSCSDSVTSTLTISNSGAGNLNYSLTACNVVTSLATTLSSLNTNYSLVNSVIPGRYDFSDGISGLYISDGGNDMYDAGNYINTNLGTNIPYSDNAVVSSTALGSGGKYFTRKFQGLWVFAADINNISKFYINGGLGADGSGTADATTLTVTRCGKTYKGFVKRVYNAGDPSVNHLIIVEDNVSLIHTYATYTNDDMDTVKGLNSSTRIYCLVYAGQNGGYIDNTATLNIMNKFLDAVNGFPQWQIVGPPTSGVVAPSGGSVNIPVKLKSTGLTVGQYTSTIYVNSNDLVNPQIALPCTLTVSGTPKVTLNKTCLDYGSLIIGTSSKDSVLVSNTGCDTLKATNVTVSPAGAFTVTPTSKNIAPGQSVYFQVTFAPASAATYSSTLTFDNSNANDTSICLTGTGIPPLSLTVPLAASYYQSLAICDACDDAFAWGFNNYGQLGDATTTERHTAIQSKILGVSAVAAGFHHTVMLKTTGTVWDWGYNGYGQLGDATFVNKMSPVQVTGLSGTFLAVAASYYQSFALKSNGTLWAWGNNGNGQLGDGTTSNRSTPVQVSGLTGVTAMASGFYHTLAVKSDGTVWAWGYNGNGQLGNNTYSQSYTPVQVHGPGDVGFLTGVVAVAAGENFSMALKNDGTVWAWGYNGYGQLGNNTYNTTPTPVQVLGTGGAGFLTGITAISAGAINSIALKNDGTVWGWGYNGYGQLGTGNYNPYITPIQATLTGTCTAIASGYHHTIAMRNDGTVWGFGNNANGQLGDGTITQRNAPVRTKNMCPTKAYDIHIPISSSCTQYDTLILGNNDPKSFKVYNLGCDTLRLSNVTSSSSEFTIVSYPAKLAALDSGVIIVSLTPTATGTVTSTVSVFDNDPDPDTTFCVKGVVIPRPIISSNPTSFDTTLACVDSVTKILTLSNTGGSKLIYSINIQNPTLSLPSPITPTCSPAVGAKSNCCSMGIYNVKFNSINNTTVATDGRYLDYTSTQSTIVTPGQTYSLSVETAPVSYNENTRVWIDFNNNGAFEAGELVLSDGNFQYHTALVTIPATAVKNKAVRMRVASDYTGSAVPTPCSNADYGQTEDYTVKILGWVLPSPSTGTVNVASSQTVAVTFNSKNLSVGTYTANISISNNDPQNNPKSVLATLHVVGAGKIGLSKTCVSMPDSTMQYTTRKDSLYIKNTGCDTLKVTNIVKNTATYSISATSFNILTGDSAKLMVTFAPTTAGILKDTLKISSNDIGNPLVKVCLSGKSYARPILSTAPTSLSYTLACCDSVTAQVKVKNTGGSNLVTSEMLAGGLPNPSNQFLILDHGRNKSSFSGYTTQTVTEAGFSTMTTSQMKGHRVIYMEPSWSNYGYLTGNMTNLASYVNQGGVVVINIAGNIGDATNVDPMGTDYSRAATHESETFTLPAHPYLTGSGYNGTTLTTGDFSSWSSTDHGTLLNTPAGAEIVLTNSNGPAWIHYKYGAGDVILTTLTYRWGNSPNNTCDNLVKYAFMLAENAGSSWLTASPTGDTIAPADSSILSVKFKSCGLTVGTYTTNLTFVSNDPLKAKDTIPCSLKVVGAPKIVLTKTCMYLDSIIAYSNNKDSLYIKNTGCDTLKVTSITKNTTLFSVNTTTVNILPGDSAMLRVTFAPVSAGTFYDTLKIYNNDVLKTVCLSGKAFSQPVQCHVANSYTVHFTACEDSILDTLAICNTGPGNLNYNLWSPYGKVSSYDGSGDFISTPLNIDQSSSSPGLTMEAWAYPTNNSGAYQHVISTDNGGYDWSMLRIGSFWYVFTGESVRSTGLSVDVDQWQHIAAVFIPGYGVKFYKNGVASTIPFIDYDASDNNINLGSNPGFGEYFEGKIDEARVFNTKLTQAEILASMTKTLTGTESGLKGYWNFDNGTANDGSVNGNNGTLNGNAAITTTANVTFVPASTGTVVPSGTYSVQVKFKKAGLAASQTIPIYLNSNDPLNPSDTVNATVIVDAAPPSPTAGSNSPVCGGLDLSLTASTVAGATYSWIGPAGFTSSLQNPVINGITTAEQGTYSVVATVTGCPPGVAGTTTVTVNPPPSVPSAGSNSTVCTGKTLSLTASTISGATYSWTGPGSFTSSLQNPTIGSVTTAAGGTYSVTATVAGCPPTAAGTTTVVINVTPSAPAASSNSPVCAGNNLSLSASTIAGVSYAWAGPNNFTDATQNTAINGVTTAGSGTYSVTATANGCISNAGTTSVTVNPPPSAPSAGSNSTVCSGKTLSLTASTISGATYAWMGPGNFTASVQNPTVSGVSTAAAGTYSVTATVGGCPTTAAGTTTVVINPTPAAPTATNSSPVCVGSDVTLTASTVGGSTYTWTGPSSYTSTSQVSVGTSMTVAKAGTYSVTATEFGCTSTAGTTTVVVNTPPSAPSASSNTPVCVGSTLSLTAGTIAGATYSWTGPGSFTASVQNPTLSSVGTVNAGTYSVTASTNGCIGTAGTTSVVVNTPPSVPSASNNSTVCSGQVLSLTASTVAGATYSWTGPNNFTSSVQNPTISSVSTAANGTYSVSAVIAGCSPSAPGTTTATVNQTPGAPSASSNSPVCAGNNLSLTASTISGATYSWSGPNNFTDVVQNPIINGVTVAGTGTYSVTATVLGCTGSVGTTSVTVNPPPGAPTAGSPGTICSGTVLTLSASAISGATYSWTGPNSFTSSVQNPSIPSVTTAGSGTYSVTALVGGCPVSTAGTTSVQVNQTPGAPTGGSNSPVCVGSDISLTASTMSGVSYAWTGPGSFTNSTQNPVITGASTAMSGTYSVTATSLGCTGPKGTTTVIVNPAPGIPTPGSNTPVCSGTTLSLTANSISGATYTWAGPNNFSASVQNPSIAGISTDGAGTYSVYATVGGCPPSGTGTTTVVVNQSPAAPSAGSNSPVCSGQTLSLSANTIGGATYSWSGPASFTSTSEDPSRPTVTTAMAGSYSVVATVSGCLSPAGTVSVTINQTPGAPTITGSSTICSGQTLSLTASSMAGATYVWTGPNSFTVSTQSMSIANITTSDAGTYSVVATNTGCAGPAGTVTVTINQTPAAPGATSNSPVCSGQTLSLSAGTVSGATYAWSGPNSFTSSLQNPNIASVTTADNGTYSVTAAVSGCGSSASTTSVVVNQTPSAPSASNNTPVCVGSPFTLSASTIPGATYSWNGPNSFTDVSQNPSIASAATTHTGTYSVTATVNGCTGPAGTTSVSISIPPPVPTASNNSTICSGQTLSLTAGTITGAAYSWSGPNGFTSSLQNPTITGAGTADAGTYSVTATTAGCPPSTAGTTTATVNQTPSAPVASANSPICVGFTLSLNASSAGTSYSWNGPASFTSTLQNPTLASISTVNAGTYSVTATTLGCTGPAGTASVVVNTIPAQPVAADQSTCEGSVNPAFTATGSNIQWYDNAMTFLASGSSYTATVTPAGTYTFYATQTVNGCESPGEPVLLTINALPPAPAASNDVSICLGNPAPTFSVTGSNIQWYNSSGAVVGTSGTFTPSAGTPGVFTYYVTQTNTVTTCESMRDSVKLTINSIAPPVAPDVAVCFGNPVPPLTATGTGIQWYDSNQNPVFSGSPFNTGQSTVGTYTYYVTQTNTVTTCSSPKDTVYLIISTQPTAAPVVADAAACFGTTIPSLVATTGTIINWHSDAGLTNQVFSGNPFNTGLTAPGSYTFFATDSTPGCGEGPVEPVVLTIHSLPATLSVNDTASCFGATTPDLITSGTNIQWYNSSLAVVSTNDTLATGQTVVGTYTYYVTQTNTVTTCESAKDTVHLTIHALPLKPTALDTAVCSASVIPNLVSAGTNVQWYDTAGTFLFTGNSYATGHTAPGTYPYLVTQKDAVTGCESPADTSVLAILLTPPVPVANNVAVCQGNPIPALVATGYTPKWYNSSALTTLVHTGNTFSTGNTAVGVYTYWVKDSLSGCVSSSADSASLTINAAPAKPSAGDATICIGAAPTLTTTATNAHWFNDATLINMVGAGSPFNTGITGVGTYTYYVTDFAAGCGNSVSDTAVITINPNPLVTVNTYTTTITQGDSTLLNAYNASSFTWAPPTGLNTTTGASVVASPTVTTTYTVTGTNSYGCSSSVSILVIVNPLSVASVENPVQDVHIYPNPAIGNFTLEFNTTAETPIDIYMINALGDKVRVMQADGAQGGGLMKHKYNIDASTLTEGVYNIEIVTDHGSVNRRVVLFR